MKSRILFTDAIIHTGRAREEAFSSMLVENGVILELDPAAPQNAKRVSLGGRHVYPCFIDGHVHLLPTVVLLAQGFEVCSIENGGISPDTLAGVEKKLRAFAATRPEGAMIVGNNYIATAIAERRLPNREELDEWCGGRPVAIYTIDGHASALSTAMLKRLGIDPEGHSGVLMGEAHERIQGRLTDAISSTVTLKTLAQGVAALHNVCAGYGISCIGALEGNGDSKLDLTTRLIVLLARHFDLDVRFYFQYMDIKKALPFGRKQKRLRIGGCGDWEMDGASGAHSAAFSLPYRDTGKTAPCYYSQELVDEKVHTADAMGYQIACHAIGDLAVERITTALEKLGSKTLHRIEHCEFASDEAIDRIAHNGWAIMAQPGYSWIDKRFLHTYDQYLPDELIARLKFRTLVEKGICVCGSTDSPVQPLDPWQQMLGMTQFYNEDESISAFDAFRCYTANPAKAMLEDNERGMLLPGMRADFFTCGCDIFSLGPEALCECRPEATYYLGRRAKEWKGSIAELILMLLKKPKKV